MVKLNSTSFARPERMTVPAATKLTPSEHREALEVIKELNGTEGIDGVTLSSLTRTALVTWIRAYHAETAGDD